MSPTSPRSSLSTALAVLLLAAGSRAWAAGPAEPPSVLLVVLDDVGNEYVACYGEGPDKSQPPTPNLDALAARGMRFTNAYSQPVCSPTRAALLTGRYGFRTGISDNVKRQDALDLGETTLFERLDAAGVGSMMFGKWHLGRHQRELLDPVLHGARLFRGTKGNLDLFEQYDATLAWRWTSKRNLLDTYAPSRVTDDAILAMSRASGPWLTMVSHHLAHTPIHTPPAPLHDYGADPPDRQRQFEAMVQTLDTELGRLLEKVDLSTTMVFVVGDNGVEAEFSESRNAKGTVFEAGVNVPLIVAGPLVRAKGAVSEALVNVLDLHATITEMHGLPAVGEDSVSLLPILRDPQARTRDFVYAEVRNEDKDRRMVRGPRYKLIRLRFQDTELFYDLSQAPPNQDGDPLCANGSCPDGLDEEARAEYARLSHILDTIRDS